MKFTVEIEDDTLQSAIDAAAARFHDLRPKLAEIGEYLVLRTRENFDREADPDGNPWAALSPAYAKRKAQSSTSLPDILTSTGALRDTITYQVSPSAVEVGSPMAYAVYHQFGTTRMPARPFLALDAQARADIAEILLG